MEMNTYLQKQTYINNQRKKHITEQIQKQTWTHRYLISHTYIHLTSKHTHKYIVSSTETYTQKQTKNQFTYTITHKNTQSRQQNIKYKR